MEVLHTVTGSEGDQHSPLYNHTGSAPGEERVDTGQSQAARAAGGGRWEAAGLTPSGGAADQQEGNKADQDGSSPLLHGSWQLPPQLPQWLSHGVGG